MSSAARQPGGQTEHWEWQLQAACRAHPIEMFFSPEGERGLARVSREAAAKVVCRSCPVLLACQGHALRTREPHGIWGGLSGQERQRLLDQELTGMTQPSAADRPHLPDNPPDRL
jgi:WhiB family redox-sensing transcriptional regulator